MTSYGYIFDIKTYFVYKFSIKKRKRKQFPLRDWKSHKSPLLGGDLEGAKEGLRWGFETPNTSSLTE